MKTNKNISNRVFHIVGFENGHFINIKMTLAELVSNGENDSELLYTLQDDRIDEILDLQINENLLAKSSRDDNQNNNILICRI